MEGVTGLADKSKKKDKSKMKKKKNEKPKLCIIDLSQENEVVECQLEVSNNHSVNFKFNPDEDKPDEIADSLVSRASTFPQTNIMDSCLIYEWKRHASWM